MLLITLQIVFLLSAILIPLYTKIRRAKTQYKIDTNTDDANYAINEEGLLERYSRIHLGEQKLPLKD